MTSKGEESDACGLSLNVTHITPMNNPIREMIFVLSKLSCPNMYPTSIVKNEDVEDNMVCEETDVKIKDALLKKLEENQSMQKENESFIVSLNVRGCTLSKSVAS